MRRLMSLRDEVDVEDEDEDGERAPQLLLVTVLLVVPVVMDGVDTVGVCLFSFEELASQSDD